MTLSVVMPVYNEARTIAAVIEPVLNAPVDLAKEIIVVDDGSTVEPGSCSRTCRPGRSGWSSMM